MKPDIREFEGRCALVTGGARNIGLAVAETLALMGASVAVLDICRNLQTIPYAMSSAEDLEKAVTKLSSSGGKALGVVCDVRDEDQVRRAVRKILDTFGRLDFLVNNAGVSSLFPIGEISEEAWDEVIDICLKGSFFCCKHVLPVMIGQGYGKIVNIASVAGVTGLGLSVHYCAAKHGVLGLTKSLAMEVADHHINVNAVCPGTVASAIPEGLARQIRLEGDPYRHFSSRHLFQDRRICPVDVAHAVRWLVSEESRCLTGAVINVDAGWSAT